MNSTDSNNVVKEPDLPVFDFVTDDSPSCHQSLKHWGNKSAEIGGAVHGIASSLHHYHETGHKHYQAGNMLSGALTNAAKSLKNDDLLEEPLLKFADAFNRIECYRDMLLTQTEMLGVQPMVKMVKEFDKMRKCKTKLTKASENLHVSWEKFAGLPHKSHMQDPQQLDKYAHNMITSKQRYQLLLSQYIDCVRDTNSRKKVVLLQRLLEHMLAEFSFYNYCSQILKDLEPYMNSLFENIQQQVADCEKNTTEDEDMKRQVEVEIDLKAQSERKVFPDGDQWPSASQSTGRFLNKVGGMISSGVKDLKKSYKEGSNMQKSEEEQDWEVIDEPNNKKQDGVTSTSNDDHSTVETSQFYLPANDEGELPEYLVRQTSNQNIANETTIKNEETNIKESIEENVKTEEDGMGTKVAPLPDQPTSNKFSSFPFAYKSTHEDEFCKKGYLRIKQKAFPKSKYPLLYFILDKKYGEILSQGQDQRNPSLFAKLMLSAVRTCDVMDTDRNYCFQLITSDSEHTLQARSHDECQSWMKAIQDGIGTALGGNQERKRTQARGKSMKDTKNQRRLSTTCHEAVDRIKAVQGNSHCADCNCPRPGWASASIGIAICIECSGIHRGLGVHISKVKSLSLDKWEADLVQFMEEHGNTKVNSIYEGNLGSHEKITRSATKTERLKYITMKYVDKSFMQLPSDEIDNKEDSSEYSDDDILATIKQPVDDQSATLLSVMCLVKDCEDCKKGLHQSQDSIDKPSWATSWNVSLDQPTNNEDHDDDNSEPKSHPLE